MAELAIFLNTIGGQLVAAKGAATFESANPYTGQPWARIPHCAAEDVDMAVAAARQAFVAPEWRGLTATQRGKLLMKVADLIEERADDLAAIESHDNGKLIIEMGAQLHYIPEWYRYFGGLADKVEGRVLPIDKPAMYAFTRHEPLGVIACIIPWNSPLLLLTWKLAPALAAGNTVVIKPSEHASASTLAFVELFEKAGFPRGVVNTVTGFPEAVGDALVRHPDVAKVAFTGGDKGGIAVYRGVAEELKQATLELGGKSANIIFADANLPNAVNGAIAGIFAATGQTCIAGSRLLVQREVHDEVVRELVRLASTARMGDPSLPQTQVGPITTEAQRQRVLEYIELGRHEGARCVLGGGIPEAPELRAGWFIEPTIFTEVRNTMRIAREEIFGPVLCVIPFADEREAIQIANDSTYGLAAGVWTSDTARMLRVSEQLQTGTVWINTYRAVSFMAPFGGYKRSGFGRESGQDALHNFLQTKTIWMDMSGKVANPFVIR